MDAVSEVRLSLISREIASKVRLMAGILASEGCEIRVVQGLRSWNEQDVLWRKGRDLQGHVIDPHAVVTNAPGGHSWHNFGLAVDCAPDDPTLPGYQIDWNPAHPQWKHMEDVGRACGLTAGADFKRLVDHPHFQLEGRFPIGAPDDEVRQLFKDGGMQAVWDEAGKR